MDHSERSSAPKLPSLTRLRRCAAAVLPVAAVLAGGCSSDGGDDDDGAALADSGSAGGGTGGSEDGTGGRSGSGAALFGAFTIEYREELAGVAAHAVVSGQLFDAGTTAVQSKVDTEIGDCSLLVPDFPACGACDGICVADGDCQPAPMPVDAGDVVLEGARGGDVSLSRDMRMFFYQADSALAFPPCDEGAEVMLRAPGFSATTPCVAPLVLLTAEPVSVKTGSGVPLEWTPPREPSGSRIAIKLDISHHGGKKGEIACNVPDTGSFELPEPLVSKLIALGVAAQPTIGLKREATTQATGAPDVRFTIVSPLERAVDTGLASCLAGEACPEGTTCDSNTKLCR
jgi:hypothetical protein